ncbi:hypothetical protein Tco_1238508 [Tanacetum coccineum]
MSKIDGPLWQLETKVDKTSAYMTKLVGLLSRVVKLVDTSAPQVRATAEGEKDSRSQPNNNTNVDIHSAPAQGGRNLLMHPPTIFDSMPYDRFTASLFGSHSSQYTPIPPPKMADKGKGKAQTPDDDALKQIMAFRAPSLSSLKHFRKTEGGPMTLEEANMQLQETNILAELKAAKDKSKHKLRMLTPAQLKAQEQELSKIKAERIQHMNKMRDEYIHCISFRDDPLPIKKFSYRVCKFTKIATIRVTRNNQPLNYKIFDNFKLKMLGFTQWLELHILASKRQNATNDQLLKNLKAKFKWVATTADKLGLPPPPQLTESELPPTKQKRKRRFEVMEKVFLKEDIVVDGMHRNLTVPDGVIRKAGLKYHLASTTQTIQNLINIDSEFAQEVYDEFIYEIESRPDFIEARNNVAKNLDVITEYSVNISKMRAFWSLNKDILNITILKTNTPYPSRKLRRIRACTHQRPQRNKAQYAVSRETQYAALKI